MSTRFQVKRSTVSGVTPTTGDIAAGELAVNLPDKKLFTSNGSTISELGSNLTSLSVGNTTAVQISNSSGLFVNGNIGIGTTVPSAKLDVVGTNVRLFETVTTDNIGDQALIAHYLDVNMTGTDTLTANREHTAFRVDVDATATGGNTTNQHLVRGIYNTVDVTGTSSQIYGVHNAVRALNTSGTVSAIYAALNACSPDPGVGGTVSTAYGSLNQAYAGGAGVIDTIYGTRNEAVVEGAATGGVVDAYGAFNEIEIDGNTLTNGYATRSVMNIDGGVTTNAFLYYGDYQGANATNVLNSWGLYLSGATKNYISGNVGINNTAPNATLAVTGTANVSGSVDIGGNLTVRNNTVFNINSGGDAVRITQTGSGSVLVVEDTTNPDSTPFQILSDGDVLVGRILRQIGTTSKLEVQNDLSNGHVLASAASNSGSVIPTFMTVRSRAASQPVVNDDNLGQIEFRGLVTDTSFNSITPVAALIQATVDVEPFPEAEGGNVPGRIVFSTTPESSGGEPTSPIERMRITSSGNVGIGNSAPNAKLTVTGTANISGNVVIGGSLNAVNVTATVFTGNLTGTAANATNLGGIAAASYVQNTDSRTLSGTLTFSNNVILTRASGLQTGNGQIYLNGATGNRIDFNTSGVAAPTTTTRSAGTKIVLYPGVSATNVDYALGIEGNVLWYSVPGTTQTHRWYGGTSQWMNLTTSGLAVSNGITANTISVGNTTVNVSINSTSITVTSDPLVQQSDIGTAPDQIPLNQYLGTLAYQSDTVAVSNTFTIGSAAVFVANGNVGLGNTSPTHKLSVQGDISLSGGVHANGSLGAAGQALVSNGSSVYWGNIFTPAITSLTANVITTSNVVSPVSELVAAVGTDQVWLVDVFGIYRSAATTTGIRLGISAPTNSTTVNDIRIRQAADGTASIFEGMTSGNTTISSASVVAANTDYGFTIRSMVRTGNTAGNLNLQLASEVNTSQITLMPGTTMIAIRIQ